MPRGTNAPKLWPAEPVNLRRMVSSGRPCAAEARRDLVAEQRADGAVDVANRQRHVGAAASVERVLAERDQLLVERLLEAVVLPRDVAARDGRRPAGGS